MRARFARLRRRGDRVGARRRLLTAKVVRVDVDEPFRPIHVEDRYAEVLLIVFWRGRVVGQVLIPALSIVAVELQQATIANELGDVLGRHELREAFRAAAREEGALRPSSRAGVSVVVCTRDRPEQLRSCLDSLLELRTPPFEIVVVDNAATDGRSQRACEEYPVRYVREPTPGVSRARNRGIFESTGDLIAFTDDDCVVDPGWLDGVDEAFADALVMVETGYVGPVELETPAQYLFEAQGGFDRGFERIVYDGLRDSPVLVAARAGAGANMVFRRRLFTEIGLFAEDLGPGTPARAAEETYTFYRALPAGYRIVFDPRRIVWHRHRRSEAALRTLLFDYGVAVTSFSTRCLVRHREPEALVVFAWWFLYRLPQQLGRIVRRDDRRLPLQLVLAEAAGGLLGPWHLLRSRLGRRRRPPLDLPAVQVERGPTPVVRAAVPHVSVVVPSYNRREGLRALLAGLERQSSPPEAFEAVVVLDGSTDGSADVVRSLDLSFPVRLVEQPNGGAASARNRGAHEARHPLLVFLDDDIVPEQDFIWRHAAAHRAARDLVVVGYCPPMVRASDLWSHTVRAWWEDHFRRKAEQGHRWSYTDFTVGNSSLPRSLYLAAGGLDEGFASRGREDWELGVRLLANGVDFRYEPAAVGRHHLDPQISTRLRQLRQEARDDILFAMKHPQVKSGLLVAELATLVGHDRSQAARAYRHLPAAEALASAAIPILGLYEGLRMRRRWGLLMQKLIGLTYLLGVADVLSTPERLLAFFAPTWAEEPVLVRVSLDRPGETVLPFGAGAVELAIEFGGREVTRIAGLNRDAQWSWDELAERVFGQAVWDARSPVLLRGLAFGSETEADRPREVAHAG